MISSKETGLTKEEFEIFLLIYAAHVDYEFSQEEKKFILSRHDKKTFEKMHDLFLNNNDYACMKIILLHKPYYYQKQEERDYIFNLLKDIFKIDGDYSRIEKVFIQYFQRIIEA